MGHNEPKTRGLHISICESKRGGTIIPSTILQTTQNVNLITFKCKRNDLFITKDLASIGGTQFQEPS
jgi:hypothetical protein